MLRQGSLRIGRFFGIDVFVHRSWIIIAALIIFSLTSDVGRVFESMATTPRVLLATLVTLLLYVSILFHEFGHSLVAKYIYKIDIDSITLFIFGGVASIRDEPKTPGSEFWIAIAGPIVSFVLGFGCMFAAAATLPVEPLMQGRLPADINHVQYIALVLGSMNLFLGIFNLLPGFPMDGGRIVRSIVWKISGSIVTATRWAAVGGSVIGFGLAGFGIAWVLGGAIANGLIAIFMGMFLHNIARQHVMSTTLREGLKGLNIPDLMSRDVHALPAHLSITEALRDYFLAQDRRTLPVVDASEQYLGMLSIDHFREVPRSEWDRTSVQSIMREAGPQVRLTSVDVRADTTELLRKLLSAPVGAIAVLMDGRLVGIVSRERVLTVLGLRNKKFAA